MAARSKARKRALDVLFASDQTNTDLTQTLTGWVARADPPVPDYSRALVAGVAEHAARIDGLIEEYAQEWSLARLPAVDRCLLRLSIYELLWCDDVPDAVVIDEAVELAKSLSTEESAGFVNGMLARLLASRDEQQPTSR